MVCREAFHEVSVYPRKEVPFFILFTGALCSCTAILALLTHQYPEPMGIVAKTVSPGSRRRETAVVRPPLAVQTLCDRVLACR